jgi:hypothetical protein
LFAPLLKPIPGVPHVFVAEGRPDKDALKTVV